MGVDRRRLAMLAGCVLAATGCEPRAQGITMDVTPKPLRLEVPTPGYRLDPGLRAKVFPGYDVDALERLLSRVTPERRSEILSFFLVPDNPGDNRGRGLLMVIKDGDLQALLEEVWAPMWDYVGATDEDITTNAYGYPGREIARARRAARAAAKPAS